MFASFVRANLALSRRINPRIVDTSHAYTKYREIAGQLLRSRPGAIVLDIGAGREWHLDSSIKRDSRLQLIGLDIDDSGMKLNEALDRRLVGDACKDLRVDDGSVDVITARAAIEHLPDTAGFVRNAYAALKPGGTLMVVFANRYAPFAILNRLLPESVALQLLAHLVPDANEKLGFKAYYDRCGASQFRRLLRRNGFEVRTEYHSYFSSFYFRFFAPLFLASLAYDWLRHSLRLRDLSSFNLFVARKPSPDTRPGEVRSEISDQRHPEAASAYPSDGRRVARR